MNAGNGTAQAPADRVLLAADGLTAGYGAIDAVTDVSLRVGEGEAVCLLGPNGAGKTTLVRALAGWQKLRGGRVLLGGRDISGLRPWRRITLGLGVVPEGGRVFRDLTVEENLRVTGRNGWQRGYDFFPVLAQRRQQLAGSLSGGERQMLALSRALVHRPQLLVVDEASFGLMPQAVQRIFATLAELRDAGVALLVVEQRDEAALALCSRGYVMGNGSILAAASADELASRDELRRLYLEGA